jgi:hypothetical protein
MMARRKLRGMKTTLSRMLWSAWNRTYWSSSSMKKNISPVTQPRIYDRAADSFESSPEDDPRGCCRCPCCARPDCWYP